jgi:hypothetical protein
MVPFGGLSRRQGPICRISHRGVKLIHSYRLPKEEMAFRFWGRYPELELRPLERVG